MGETLDTVYTQYETIWQRLALTAVRRYRLPLTWLHYDITSTYFEGAYSDSELIKYGYNRDQRPDTKQLNIGLTTLQDGLPLAFRVLVGNTSDKTTARQILEAVQQLLAETQTTDLTIVHDRGMATAETLVWYDRRRQRFISPVTADTDLQAVLDAVPTTELLAHPLAYQPQRAASDTPPAYHGVWQEHTVTFAGQSAHLRVLVVHSASKARLDAEKRQAALAKLQPRRHPNAPESAQVQAPGLYPGANSSGPARQLGPRPVGYRPARRGWRSRTDLPSQRRTPGAG